MFIFKMLVNAVILKWTGVHKYLDRHQHFTEEQVTYQKTPYN